MLEQEAWESFMLAAVPNTARQWLLTWPEPEVREINEDTKSSEEEEDGLKALLMAHLNLPY